MLSTVCTVGFVIVLGIIDDIEWSSCPRQWRRHWLCSSLGNGPVSIYYLVCSQFRQSHHQHVSLQTNSLLATKWLTTNIDYPLEFLDCRWLMSKPWVVCIKHMWKEANSCADLLVKRGASQSERDSIWHMSHLFVAMSLLGLHGFCLICK